MAITSLASYEAAAKEKLRFSYVTGTSSLNQASWKSPWRGTSLTGTPTNMPTLSSTTSGAVPVAGDQGFNSITGWSNNGYVTHIECTPTATAQAGHLLLIDRLFHCGAYNVNNTSQTLSSQPSYSGRIPGGNYAGTQIWIESVTAQFSSTTLTITYTDQSGNTGHSTAVTLSVGSGNPVWAQQIPLASGDSGVQKIESVTTSAAGSGTFIVVVVRPIANMFFDTNNIRGYTRPLEMLMREIYQTSALQFFSANGSTSAAPIPFEAVVEIASN